MFHPAVLKTLAPLMLIGAAAAFAPGIASAAYSNSPNSVITATKVVRFQDLKLDQAGDVAALYARIRRAAAQVCSAGAATPVQRDCYEEAIATAVARVNNPSLTAYHEHRTGAGMRTGM